MACVPVAAPAAVADEFTIEARDFDAGNARVSLTGEAYADGPSCIWNAGELPNWVEYEINFPVNADYALHALYAAEQARPVRIDVDGRQIATGFQGVTGGWNTSSARWEQQCAVTIAAGTHTLRLHCDGPFPHICAIRLASSATFPVGWQLVRPTAQQRAERARVAARRAQIEAQIALLEAVDVESVRLAIDDLAGDFPGRYDADQYRPMVERFERQRAALLQALAGGTDVAPAEIDDVLSGVRTALLANPLLDVDRLLAVRRNFGEPRARQVSSSDAGFVAHNFQNQTAMPRTGWDNDIVVLSQLRMHPQIDRLYKPAGDPIVRDLRLDFPADRFLFSSIDTQGRWAIFQTHCDGTGLTQLTPTSYPDLDFFDACYLPDGRVIVCSTGNYYGLPCLEGQGQIASLYLLDPATQALRQLTFDQDSDADPTVLNDGRVLYQRWEYSDIPHYFARRRMTMNPDGTTQLAFHGSNSWFPTAFRFAEPVPDHPTRLVGIISGHHDYGDCGRLAILDPGLAGGYPFRFRPTAKEWGVEGEPIAVTPDILPAARTGFVQLIPGRGEPVAGTVCDAIVGHVYYKQRPELTTHPFPLSSKYFLVSRKPTPQSLWGIYLVDVFDNATLIAEVDGAGLFEPQPLAPRPRPPVIPDRVQPAVQTAAVHIADIYGGPGLRGVPRGTVKRLRVFAYHFGYNNRAGFPHIGIQAGWDIKRVLGTATVEADGSAHFQIPANTPVSLQPLDEEGRALQLMRSWLVGMPGERVSCVGCHEPRRETLPLRRSLAHDRQPEELRPWYGGPRPFAFDTEVFPVLERYCIGCHDQPAQVGPRSHPCFRDPVSAYDTLHPYIHRPGVEADMALLYPLEYHASTSLLIQMLERGHHGVRLSEKSREARERLYCWIDLNVPRAGSWNPPSFQGHDQRQRRRELSVALAGRDDDPEGEYEAAVAAFRHRAPVPFLAPPPDLPPEPDGLTADGFPCSTDEATARQGAQRADLSRDKTLDLGAGVQLTCTWIPAGEFVMGSLAGAPDERPRSVVRISRPFWMSVTEVTNAQFARFDPHHDTRYIDMHSLDRVVPGHIANHPAQPVSRVAWTQAMGFCQWLGAQTGLPVTLPTEAQWEWAARAGTETQFFYGTLETDFGRFANLADQALRWYSMGYDGPSALQRRNPYPPEMNFPLHDPRFRDNWFVVDYVGQTHSNAWGLHDMVGNVSEWTRTSYRPYPYDDQDARNDLAGSERKVARGGSWADRPADAGSSVRRAYEPWQPVYDVGFRVIIEDAGAVREMAESAAP
ncbi:MAG: SUMF1/EgtB/PvdO family nonheme iron enzyme [Pirellulaceae bacterium]|jgi:formylglycine-generating enzyme required for sulfatase activity|nr:SUMF1/EgtB/PvdO family nonheme iron enzyme [Pirellulaceae bacterium]